MGLQEICYFSQILFLSFFGDDDFCIFALCGSIEFLSLWPGLLASLAQPLINLQWQINFCVIILFVMLKQQCMDVISDLLVFQRLSCFQIKSNQNFGMRIFYICNQAFRFFKIRIINLMQQYKILLIISSVFCILFCIFLMRYLQTSLFIFLSFEPGILIAGFIQCNYIMEIVQMKNFLFFILNYIQLVYYSLSQCIFLH
eukprot:TRINITY_DN2122_c0_g1_i10.p3 TRINITY_DN2122_c0_g1~~TRINITY_DN2122_c0_g1_i10.p3  ORF type:complete len:200 (+),score=-15.96 TRINITY_DN2122_c0_g1_i10:391-990(+)